MYRTFKNGLCTLGIGSLLLATTALDVTAADPVILQYQGYNPETIAAIYQGNWAVGESELSGELYLPDGDGPFPVVVFQHGSGHKDNLESWYRVVIPSLHKAGIGGFVANSYDGRGLRSTVRDQRRLSKSARIVDALMALKSLSAHPKVDAARIGVTGYSFGGIVALETADRRTVESVLGKELRFAAHLPVYPSCTAHREKIDMTGAPMLILAGADDDYTLARFCESYVPKLVQAGFPVSIKVYPDAGHSFVHVIDRYLSKAATFNRCGPATLTSDGYHVLDDISDRGGSWADFVGAAFRKCSELGAHLYGTRKSRMSARDDTVAFFARNLSR